MIVPTYWQIYYIERKFYSNINLLEIFLPPHKKKFSLSESDNSS